MLNELLSIKEVDVEGELKKKVNVPALSAKITGAVGMALLFRKTRILSAQFPAIGAADVIEGEME